MSFDKYDDPAWLSGSAKYDQDFSVKQLQDFLKELDKVFFSTKERLRFLECQSGKIKKSLLTRIDVDALEVSTPQANFYATPEGRERLLSMSEGELQEYFFDRTSGISESQKQEVYCYCRRFFTGLSSSVVERALQANRNHLAGTHLMLEAWMNAGQPERFTWRILGAYTESRYRMVWPYEDHRQRLDLRRKESSENLLRPLSTAMLLELQYVHVRREWSKRQRSSTELYQLTSRSVAARRPARRPPLPAIGRLRSDSDLSQLRREGSDEGGRDRPKEHHLSRQQVGTGGSSGGSSSSRNRGVVPTILSQVKDVRHLHITESPGKIPVVKPRTNLEPPLMTTRYGVNKCSRSGGGRSRTRKAATTSSEEKESQVSSESSEEKVQSLTTPPSSSYKIAKDVVEDILLDVIM